MGLWGDWGECLQSPNGGGRGESGQRGGGGGGKGEGVNSWGLCFNGYYYAYR